MEHEQTILEKYEKYTWKVENFSRLNTDGVFSEPFVLGGYPWRISLYLEEEEGAYDAIWIFLEVVKTANMSEGWSRHVKFKLAVCNQLNSKRTIIEEDEHEYNASEYYCGFNSIIYKLRDPTEGFIVEDVCIINVEIFVSKTTLEKKFQPLANLTTTLLVGTQASHLKEDAPVIESTKHNAAELGFSPSMGELMDFSNSRQVEKFCADHPSFVECRMKKDLAFAALGRVIYFLMTRKRKDMNEHNCKDLLALWEELEKYSFDLTWLEPHVQSALGMKSYVEKVLQAEKLKENCSIMKVEYLKLKANVASFMLSVDVERDLLKAKGLEEKDLDSELGFGSYRQ